MSKISLVLEGGGMRGAYTAGVLAWFLDQDIQFDYIVGISSGALYGTMYALERKELMRQASVEIAAHPRNVGLKALWHERTIVGYDFMFETAQSLDYPLEKIDKVYEAIDIGVYDIEQEKTIWKNKYEIAENPEYIKAACTLPIVGRAVEIKGKQYMDGGITTMIPIQKSIDRGCQKHVVITTKSQDYVRKDQGFFEKHLLRFVYRKSPQLIADFENRKDVYYKERDLVERLKKENKALYLYPSQETGVSRFGGTLEQFQSLFDIGYGDCEHRKDEILNFLK